MIRLNDVSNLMRWALLAGVFAGVPALIGCGESGGGKLYSQDFPKPEGSAASTTTDPGANLSISEGRKKEKEDFYKEPVKVKAKGRSRPR